MEAKIFSIDGRTNFAQKICDEFNKRQSTHSPDFFTLGKVRIDKFSDGEMSVDFQEYVRGQKVFLVCSTNDSDNIMKLMLAADAANRASADEIIAIMPYFGYARQDRKDGIRGAVGARVMANMLAANSISRIMCVDLHADQIQGFFNMPVDHISGWNIFYPELKRLIDEGVIDNPTICSPDAGGVKRANVFFKKLISDEYDASMVMISKMREKPNEVARMDLIGDVKGRDVVIIDDMVDTAGTLCLAAQHLKDAGATSVRAMISHGVLSGPALERIAESKHLDELIITDSLFGPKYIPGSLKIRHVSCAPQIARMIQAITDRKSANKLKEVY